MGQPFFRRFFKRSPAPVVEAPESLAELGSADAQFHLGLQFANGEGSARDYAQAAKWYLLAAEQGHLLAQFNLGVMYAGGQGVPRSDRDAEAWLGKAAHRGDAGAQHTLGVRRYRASIEGPQKDRPEAQIEAYTWFTLAAEQGYGGSEAASAMLSLRMTREEVTEATRRAAAFQAG